MKLGIGTVQFGLDYGISNREGKTTPEEAGRILEVGAENGVKILDTAALYGSSEEVLGTVLGNFSRRFSIVTKTPKFSGQTITNDHQELLESVFKQSLAKLGQTSIYGLLIHDVNDLLSQNGNLLYEKMQELKQRGLVQKVGVSVYHAKEIDAILDKYVIDLMQIPVNVLDQRLLQSGHLTKLKNAGIEIHARSAFLQGLLFIDPQMLPAHFNTVKDHLQLFHKRIRELGLSPVEAALGFVIGLAEIDTVICGVNNHHQLTELCAAKALEYKEFARFAFDDISILNPSLWKS